METPKGQMVPQAVPPPIVSGPALAPAALSTVPPEWRRLCEMSQNVALTIENVQRDLVFARRQLQAVQSEIARLGVGIAPVKNVSGPAKAVIQTTLPISKNKLFKLIPKKQLAAFGGAISDIPSSKLPPPIPLPDQAPAPIVRPEPSKATPAAPATVKGQTKQLHKRNLNWMYGSAFLLSLLLGGSLFILLNDSWLPTNRSKSTTVTQKPPSRQHLSLSPPALPKAPQPAPVPIKTPEPIEATVVVSLNPSQVAEQKRAVNAAYRLLSRRQFRQALNFCGPWVERAPDNAKLRYLYGRALFYTKNKRAALGQMEKAIKLNPRYANAFFELGGLYLHLRKADAARQALQNFLKLSPDDPRAEDVSILLKTHPKFR